jgi:hypothetical protein
LLVSPNLIPDLVPLYARDAHAGEGHPHLSPDREPERAGAEVEVVPCGYAAPVYPQSEGTRCCA